MEGHSTVYEEPVVAQEVQEVEFEDMIPQDIGYDTKEPASPVSPVVIQENLFLAERQEPEEEYFRLSVLSLKMQLYAADQSFFSKSSSQLLKECQKQEVPFHEWYDWIRSQLA